MARTGHISWLRKEMTMLCIAIFLFSYVNSAMFWHGHNVQGFLFYHSHISDKAHRSGQTDGGHTAAQLLLIEASNQASYTDDAVQVFCIEPQCPMVALIMVLPAEYDSQATALHFSLRGPPVLV